MKKFSIPNPCHENWESMSPQDKGRFCDVCSKCVYDFTKKSNSEISQILNENSHVCGRLRKSQLYSKNLVQKWAYQFNEFISSRNYKSSVIIGFASILLLITGCRKREACISTTGVLVVENDNGNIIGETLTEEDSTQHNLKNLDSTKIVK